MMIIIIMMMYIPPTGVAMLTIPMFSLNNAACLCAVVDDRSNNMQSNIGGNSNV